MLEDRLSRIQDLRFERIFGIAKFFNSKENHRISFGWNIFSSFRSTTRWSSCIQCDLDVRTTWRIFRFSGLPRIGLVFTEMLKITESNTEVIRTSLEVIIGSNTNVLKSFGLQNKTMGIKIRSDVRESY